MKLALLAIDAILSTAQDAPERRKPGTRYLPNVIEAQRSIDAARDRIVALAESHETAERN